ncbi:MAG: HAD-IIIC family phosphatase [Pseudomonadota bacterium]
MNLALQDLTWLIEPASDFRDRNRQLRNGAADPATDIAALASTRLNANQLTALSATIDHLNFEGANLAPLSPFRLGVVGQSVTNLFSTALPASAARHGVNLAVIEAEYDQLMQEALNPASTMNVTELDAVLIWLDHRALPFSEDENADAAIALVEQVRDGFAQHTATPVIFPTLSCPPEPLFGSFDRMHHGSLRNAIAAFNSRLVEIARTRSDYILDIEALAAAVGTQTWHDPKQWNLYKLSCSARMIPLLADAVGRLVGALRGKSRKCLVLDLDNTLWGGVIGDEGLEGIRLGQGDPAGEAHLEVQRMALALRDRGVLLAICSKNDEDNARLPFRKHPDMLLKEDHVSAFVANWTDKATNLETIAKTLNIGTDALVFVDDNPAERAQVREELPGVAVPELPVDPSLYPVTVLNAGYFEAVSFSVDDRKRAEQYHANSHRQEIAGAARNLDEFLDRLRMQLHVGGFDQLAIPRVTQLVNKTNQFNLTTKRYVQSEIEAFAADPGVITLQARLVDRFGDNGLITVVIGRINGTVCEVDTWLMSCRVLGRRVEDAMCETLADEARLRGATALRGRYVPTAKNGMVADLYARLGFLKVSEDGNGVTEWDLSLSNTKRRSLPFVVHRHEASVELDTVA